MGWKNDCEIGSLMIDWKNRTFEMDGIDGCSPGMTPEDVLEFLKKGNGQKEIDRFAMVFWHEPKQFCLYSIEGFLKEVWDDPSE
jgi:hypothetical protein